MTVRDDVVGPVLVFGALVTVPPLPDAAILADATTVTPAVSRRGAVPVVLLRLGCDTAAT
ncbi:MAG: hypothetical protein M3P91_01375 [Actinomycetota bacterium]|nr:hypothetical protein [Actinomycetota bacterium]